jgi:hypothetical protein
MSVTGPLEVNKRTHSAVADSQCRVLKPTTSAKMRTCMASNNFLECICNFSETSAPSHKTHDLRTVIITQKNLRLYIPSLLSRLLCKSHFVVHLVHYRKCTLTQELAVVPLFECVNRKKTGSKLTDMKDLRMSSGLVFALFLLDVDENMSNWK